MSNPAFGSATSIPIAVLYSVTAVLLISGVYLLVTVISPVCGLINLMLGGALIACDLAPAQHTGGR